MGKAEDGREKLRQWGVTYDENPKENLDYEPVLWLVRRLLDFAEIVPKHHLETIYNPLMHRIPETSRQFLQNDKALLYDSHEQCNLFSGGSTHRHEHNLHEAIKMSHKMRANRNTRRNEAFFDGLVISKLFNEWIYDEDWSDSGRGRTNNISYISHDPTNDLTYGLQDWFRNATNIRTQVFKSFNDNDKVATAASTELSRLTDSRPDRWFGFPIQDTSPDEQKNCLAFEFQELVNLERSGKLWSTPFLQLSQFKETRLSKSWKYMCFPSVLVEVKKQDVPERERRYLYTQIANATSLSAGILRLWAADRYAEHEMPVVGITFHGPDVRLFLTYSNESKPDGPNYHCQCIWKGNLRELGDAIRFRRILDTTYFWMVSILRPWILSHVNRWKKKYLPALGPASASIGEAKIVKEFPRDISRKLGISDTVGVLFGNSSLRRLVEPGVIDPQAESDLATVSSFASLKTAPEDQSAQANRVESPSIDSPIMSLEQHDSQGRSELTQMSAIGSLAKQFLSSFSRLGVQLEESSPSGSDQLQNQPVSADSSKAEINNPSINPTPSIHSSPVGEDTVQGSGKEVTDPGDYGTDETRSQRPPWQSTPAVSGQSNVVTGENNEGGEVFAGSRTARLDKPEFAWFYPKSEPALARTSSGHEISLEHGNTTELPEVPDDIVLRSGSELYIAEKPSSQPAEPCIEASPSAQSTDTDSSEFENFYRFGDFKGTFQSNSRNWSTPIGESEFTDTPPTSIGKDENPVVTDKSAQSSISEGPISSRLRNRSKQLQAAEAAASPVSRKSKGA